MFSVFGWMRVVSSYFVVGERENLPQENERKEKDAAFKSRTYYEKIQWKNDN